MSLLSSATSARSKQLAMYLNAVYIVATTIGAHGSVAGVDTAGSASNARRWDDGHSRRFTRTGRRPNRRISYLDPTTQIEQVFTWSPGVGRRFTKKKDKDKDKGKAEKQNKQPEKGDRKKEAKESDEKDDSEKDKDSPPNLDAFSDPTLSPTNKGYYSYGENPTPSPTGKGLYTYPEFDKGDGQSGMNPSDTNAPVASPTSYPEFGIGDGQSWMNPSDTNAPAASPTASFLTYEPTIVKVNSSSPAVLEANATDATVLEENASTIDTEVDTSAHVDTESSTSPPCEDSNFPFDVITDSGAVFVGLRCHGTQMMPLCRAKVAGSGNDDRLTQEICPRLCGLCSGTDAASAPTRAPAPGQDVGGAPEDQAVKPSAGALSTAVGFSVAFEDNGSRVSDDVFFEEEVVIDVVILSATRLIETKTLYKVGPPVSGGRQLAGQFLRSFGGGEDELSEVASSSKVRINEVQQHRMTKSLVVGSTDITLHYSSAKSAFVPTPETLNEKASSRWLRWVTCILAFEVNQVATSASRQPEVTARSNGSFKDADVSEVLATMFFDAIEDGSFLELLQEADSRVLGVCEVGKEFEAASAIELTFHNPSPPHLPGNMVRGYEPLNTSGLDPLRIAGVLLFLFAIISSISCFLLARFRMRRREMLARWGSLLGDENGVSNFLESSQCFLSKSHAGVNGGHNESNLKSTESSASPQVLPEGSGGDQSGQEHCID